MAGAPVVAVHGQPVATEEPLIVKSRYEQMLDVWTAFGGEPSPRTGPAWTWRPNPTPDQLVTMLSHVPDHTSLQRA